jgi:hypothetical protein
VEFYLDNAAAPFAVQQNIDVSPTFASDLLWQFHASLPAGKRSGQHQVRVLARDVAGGKHEKSEIVTF